MQSSRSSRNYCPAASSATIFKAFLAFRDELVNWSDVRSEFANDLGVLETPHRWIKVGNENLGRWLQNSRGEFRSNREPNYQGSPVEHRSISYRDLSKQLIGIVHQKEGRTCVIGAKARPLPAGVETSLVNHKFRVLEPNDLSVLRDLVQAVCDGLEADKPQAVMDFLERVFGGLDQDEKRFLEGIIRNNGQRPRRADRRILFEKHQDGVTAHLLFVLLEYIANRPGRPCKLLVSVSALKCILEVHLETGASIKTLYADEIALRKYQSRSNAYRCVGSTLLVKGLEFDHAIVLRGPDWQQNWGTYKDLYVSLTRGSKSTTLIDLAR
jgi:hypothetical protein